ncbi:NAD-dependent isocitrate dehydrogenase [Puccinia graminis f. sp. tritici]|uniref:Large ribosomal subunit protein bL27m n=1 Tax=Puccinia graminis f. sp. tritici TaxID=56615 RepID=A0A5B0R4J5_PUCGR|nr:NAD-dependent isocitrate dehydrogenase [Puccinia graminis f. sp. tritici]KAA1120621.1 NAD-dependent isocitrate dehydrogenase [Puccinia graminis f. sp. tritici]
MKPTKPSINMITLTHRLRATSQSISRYQGQAKTFGSSISSQVAASPAGTSGKKPSSAETGAFKGFKLPDQTYKMALIPGNGIGPEISESVKAIYSAVKVPITGEERAVTPVNVDGRSTISQDVIDSIHQTTVALKGPLATPIRKGNVSLNPTPRRTSKPFANVRPCRSIDGFKNPAALEPLGHHSLKPKMTFLVGSFQSIFGLTRSVNRSLGGLSHIPDIGFGLQIRTATKRAGGSTKNNRGSAGRRLGVKRFGGQKVEQGEIIIRQRGQRFHPGQDVYISKDHTIHAAIPGYVKFYQDPRGDHVGYRALSLRRQGMRKFVGVVADPDEQLPRNLPEEGRARYFNLIDLAARERNLAAKPPTPRIPQTAFARPVSIDSFSPDKHSSSRNKSGGSYDA